MNEKKICVVGLGGVGGYLGTMLASHYQNVCFYARGERLAFIREKGITMHSAAQGEVTAFPKQISDQAETLGIMDYIFLCVKDFSLVEVLAEISPMICDHTMIIPLLNGVGVAEKVRQTVRQGMVADGLVYIIAETDQDFAVHLTSPYCKIFIGYTGPGQYPAARLEEVRVFLQETGITCAIEGDIEAAIWKKYILNCAYNVLTAYYDGTTSDLRANAAAVSQLKTLLEEAAAVARKLKVKIPDDLEAVHLDHILHVQAGNSTSSLKRDMAAGKPNELAVFSGKLLELAAAAGLELPMTAYFYGELKKRSPK